MFSALANTFDISGRFSRPDFWVFAAFWAPATLLLSLFLASPARGRYLGADYFLIILALAVPLISAAIRRLHDIGHGGRFAFLLPVPLACIYGLFVGIPFALHLLGIDVFIFDESHSTLLSTDGNQFSGVFLLLGLTAFFPALGLALLATLLLLALLATRLSRPGQTGPNSYGPNPYEVTP